MATAARVKYPAALQRCKFDTPLLAAGALIGVRRNRWAGPPLPLLHGRTVLFVVAKGISVFYNTNHGLSGVQLNFIAVVIIELCRFVIRRLFPVDMDASAVGEIIAVPFGVMYLEGKITVLIPYFLIKTFLKASCLLSNLASTWGLPYSKR